VSFTFDVRLDKSPSEKQRAVLKGILLAAIQPVLLPPPGRLLRGRAVTNANNLNNGEPNKKRRLASVVGGDLTLSTNPSNDPRLVNLTASFRVDPNPEAPKPVRIRLERALNSIRGDLLNAFASSFSTQPTGAPTPSSPNIPIQTTNNSSDNTAIYISAGVAAIVAAIIAFCLATLCRRRRRTKKQERMRKAILELLKDVAPEQVVNFDAIMLQFEGKEEELHDQLKCLQIDPAGYKLEVLSPVAADNASTSSSSSGGFIFTSSKHVLENTRLGGLDVVEVDMEDEDSNSEVDLEDLDYIYSSKSIDDTSVASSHAWAIASTLTTTKLPEYLENDDNDDDDDDEEDSRDSDYVPVNFPCALSMASSPNSDDGSTTVKSVSALSVCFAASPDKSYKENLPVKVKSRISIVEGSTA
jgi:hypothetical protein